MIVRLTLLVLGASLALAQQFPPVKDWKSVRITLERTSCFGSCPAYTVEIRDGVVRYRGVYSTAVLGERKGEITRSELQQLVDEFRRADYMKLNPPDDGVIVAIMDAPTHTISASIDGASITITHTSGYRDIEFAAVIALENAIDRLAHTDKWVKGGNQALPPLRR